MALASVSKGFNTQRASANQANIFQGKIRNSLQFDKLNRVNHNVRPLNCIKPLRQGESKSEQFLVYFVEGFLLLQNTAFNRL